MNNDLLKSFIHESLLDVIGLKKSGGDEDKSDKDWISKVSSFFKNAAEIATKEYIEEFEEEQLMELPNEIVSQIFKFAIEKSAFAKKKTDGNKEKTIALLKRAIQNRFNKVLRKFEHISETCVQKFIKQFETENRGVRLPEEIREEMSNFAEDFVDDLKTKDVKDANVIISKLNSALTKKFKNELQRNVSSYIVSRQTGQPKQTGRRGQSRQNNDNINDD